MALHAQYYIPGEWMIGKAIDKELFPNRNMDQGDKIE